MGAKTGFRARRMPLSRRLDANLGYACNNKCLFCYFQERKKIAVNPSTGEVKKRLSLIRRLGIERVEMTGGEPTARNDILELVSFAKKDLGFEGVSVITNGSRFCDRDFAAKAIESGVDDVLVSVHGHNAEIHDTLTGRRGSFNEATLAVRNVLDLGASCRTNTVVTRLNFSKAEDIAGLVYELGVRKVNYIYLSPLDDARATEERMWFTYSESAPFMKGMIDSYKNKLETISVKVIPFCLLEGCEDYITDLFQNVYDPYEWDYYHRVRVRRGLPVSSIAALAGIMLFMNPKRVLEIGLSKSLREGILRVEAYRHCVKSPVCGGCMFDNICPGLWKDYARRYGTWELAPVIGEKLVEVDLPLRKRFWDYDKGLLPTTAKNK